MYSCVCLFCCRFFIALITLVILVNNGFCQTLYQENFSSDPHYTTLAPSYAYWNSTGGYYYVKTRDNLDYKYWGYSPDIGLINTSQKITIEFDVYFEYQDWGTYPGVYFYMTPSQDRLEIFRDYSFRVVNLYTDTVFKKIRINDNSGNYVDTTTISDDVWYHVSIVLNGDSTANIKVTNRSDGTIMLDKQNKLFFSPDFRYIGVGYFDVPDYGDNWSPIRVDNINIYEGTPTIVSKAETYGLFIGEDEGKLVFTTDAKNIRNKMIDAGIVSSEHSVIMSKFITTENIKLYISRFDLKKDDTLIIYYSGHAGTSDTQNGETTSNEWDEFIQPATQNAIYDDDFIEILKNLDEVNKLLILDTCHSGGFWGNGEEVGGDLEQLNKVALIAATSESWYATSYWTNGESIMTHHMMDGLEKEGGYFIADGDKNGTISVSEWEIYLNTRDWYVPFLGVNVYQKELGEIVTFTEDYIAAKSQFSKDFNYEMDEIEKFPWPIFLPAIIRSNLK